MSDCLIDFTSLVQRYKGHGYYASTECDTIIAAAYWSEKLHHGQKRKSGEDYIIHPLQVASILLSMRLETPAIVAGLLHDVLEDTDFPYSQLRSLFGNSVAFLVKGVSKISQDHRTDRHLNSADAVRDVMLAGMKDVRVLIIKLADKLHNMRTLRYIPQPRRDEIARECLDIYAPLARRLGIGWLCHELEDLAFSHIHPEEYAAIRRYMSKNMSHAKARLMKAREQIYAAATRHQVRISLKTRVKHCYSIYRKMRQQARSVAEIYDLLGIRVLCQKENDCFAMSGIIPGIWSNIKSRERDYITTPKPNNYQSIHLTVRLEANWHLEIQIRTHKMNRNAEHGIAAHWLYRQGQYNRLQKSRKIPKVISNATTFANGDSPIDDVGIKKQIHHINIDTAESTQFLKAMKQDLRTESIYPFTPKGKMLHLPLGSTALDFAYYIHSNIGDHAYAALIDGKKANIRKQLNSLQTVEILTAHNAHPRLEWLQIAYTSRARSHIRSWLNENHADLTVRHNIVSSSSFAKSNRNLTRASCCSPRMGDKIVGYLGANQNIIVHRYSCARLRRIKNLDERRVSVEWATSQRGEEANFTIFARPFPSLFADIERVIVGNGGTLISGRTESDRSGTVIGHFTIEVPDKEAGRAIDASIRSLQEIIEVAR